MKRVVKNDKEVLRTVSAFACYCETVSCPNCSMCDSVAKLQSLRDGTETAKSNENLRHYSTLAHA